MNSDELKERTKRFALRVMKLIEALPAGEFSRVISYQLMKSASSVGANYRSALRGRSRKEFAAKIGICLEEADESHYWIELIEEGGFIQKEKMESLKNEASELWAIFFSIQRSTRENDL